MTATRRAFIAGAAATGAAGVLGLAPRPARADLSVGDATLTTVSDGHLVLPESFVFDGVAAEDLAALRAEIDLPEGDQQRPCNLALWRDGDNTVLFDAGSGPDFMPTAGEILANLEAAGVAPEDITHVIFTHAHPDHIWGLLDDFDEVPFPEAAFHMGAAEWDYWWDPATLDSIGADRAAFAVGARRRMEAIEERVGRFGDGEEIVPGITAVATPGHTPGHMSFLAGSASERVLILGDAILNAHVAFARPGWPGGSDQDAAMAAATRVALLDRIVAEDLRIVGFHLPGGGIGRAERAGAGYRFLPEGA